MTSPNASGQPLLKLLSFNLFSPSSLYFLFVFDFTDLVLTGDRCKMILFFEIFFPAFMNGYMLLLIDVYYTVKYWLQLGRKKYRHKVTSVLETNHSKCVVSCTILPRAWGKIIQYTGQNDTIRLFSSQIHIFKT